MQKTFEVSGPVELDVRLSSGEISIDPSLDGRVEIDLLAHDDESQRLIDEADRIQRTIDELQKEYQEMTTPRPEEK